MIILYFKFIGYVFRNRVWDDYQEPIDVDVPLDSQCTQMTDEARIGPYIPNSGFMSLLTCMEAEIVNSQVSTTRLI